MLTAEEIALAAAQYVIRNRLDCRWDVTDNYEVMSPVGDFRITIRARG